MAGEYDPFTFWESRLTKDLSMRTVGHAGLGYAYNYWLYQAQFLAVRRLIRKHNVETRGKKLLDIGVGIGVWIPFWTRMGIAELVGLDISTGAVSFLQGAFPGGRFFQADVREPLCISDGFHIVTAIDVLYHITDDEGFSNAVRNISSCAHHGSWILVVDGFGSRSSGPRGHEHHRTMREYENVLATFGLELVDTQPIFFLMETPICPNDFRYGSQLNQLVPQIHRTVSYLARRNLEPVSHVLGATLYWIDALVSGVAKTGPSLKVALIRKR